MPLHPFYFKLSEEIKDEKNGKSMYWYGTNNEYRIFFLFALIFFSSIYEAAYTSI